MGALRRGTRPRPTRITSTGPRGESQICAAHPARSSATRPCATPSRPLELEGEHHFLARRSRSREANTLHDRGDTGGDGLAGELLREDAHVTHAAVPTDDPPQLERAAGIGIGRLLLLDAAHEGRLL